MSGPIIRSGPSNKYSENWGSVFGSGKTKKAAKTKATEKTPTKKKAAKKKKKS